jgi:type IV pilus secretin PilQ/predicted competence protein
MHRHYRSAATWLLGGIMLLSSVLAPQPGRAGDNPVTDVKYARQGGAFRLTVTAASAVSTRVHKYSVDSKNDVEDLVVDVTPASYDGRTKVIAFSDGQIRQVRVGQLSDSPAVLRIVVESQGAAKYDLLQGGGSSVTLAVRTDQAPHVLPADEAVAAARKAAAQQTAAIASTDNVQAPKAVPVKHVAFAPAPYKQPASAKPTPVRHVTAVAAPAVVAQATPNPWLPGGKYYCKIPGVKHPYTGGMSSSSNANANAGTLPRAPQYASSGTVSIDVKNADIVDVLKVLAQQSGQNIIATSSVKGTTTVSLHDVPLKTALDLVVRTNGLEYRTVGNVYVVGTPDDLTKQFGSAGQTAQTVAFPIKYADPTALGKQIGTVLPAGSFTIDPRTDTLLVTGSPDIIQSARNFLALADVPAPQVVFEVKVIDITKNNDTSNVGVSFAGSTDLGLFENCIACPAIPDLTNSPKTSLNPIAVQPFTRNAFFVSTKVNYLISHNEAELLANPRVAALDNQQASLLIGQTYPIVYYDPKAGNFQVQYIDIGVKLIITPVINTDGYITTTMNVERSVITGLVQNFPILNNRKVTDTLRVKDGDTIVLGGLLDDEVTKTITKVPLLGDIPILGALFRNVQKGKIHNEVVFLITPHIMNEK